MRLLFLLFTCKHCISLLIALGCLDVVALISKCVIIKLLLTFVSVLFLLHLPRFLLCPVWEDSGRQRGW